MEKQVIEVKQIDWFDDHFYKIRYLNELKEEIETYFPSVTTKLGALSKPQLLRWYGDLGTTEAKRRSNEAADRGTRIHWAWYYYTTNGAVVYHPPKAPLYSNKEMEEIHKRFNNQVFVINNQGEMYDFLKLKQFYEALQPETLGTEIKVFNVEHKEAGTADNIFQIKEGEYMISGSKAIKLEEGQYIFDLKTGRSVSEEHFMQSSAYMVCAESMGMGEFKGCLIGHTQADIRTGILGFKTFFFNREEALSYYEGYRDIARVWERNFGSKKPVIRTLPALVTLEKDLNWTQSTDSSIKEDKDSIEKKSTDLSSSPKEGAKKVETPSSKTISNSSSSKRGDTATSSKTPSKKV